MNYKTIEAVSKLFVLLIKYYYDKVAILNRILIEIGRVIHNGQGMNPNLSSSKIHPLTIVVDPPQYDERPYYRLFSSLLTELAAPDAILEPLTLALLLEFRDIFHQFQPLHYPGFTFSWLKLISHPLFMPKLLKSGPEQEGRPQPPSNLARRNPIVLVLTRGFRLGPYARIDC